ncbi:MAG: Na+/H+ antiporter NhaC [Flavobacteriales bacterium]|nr:MAG: Na+/H+ antiporter NhaC [Flavobacteriales bacterium]
MKHTYKDVLVALSPLIFLLILLGTNVYIMGDASQDGGNQIILILSGLLAAGLGIKRGVHWQSMMESVEKNVASTSQALIILLLIGALSGTWMAGGIVPTMMFYGVQWMHPVYYLPLTAIITAIIAIVIGSSWSTTATIGIALIAISEPLGIPTHIAAGAIISGAYFGDKISPLSDTTNLAAAMAGTDVVSHIKYLMITTVPSFLITLILFAGIGYYFLDSSVAFTPDLSMQIVLEEHFHISAWYFIVPLLVVILIAKKVPAIPALSFGVLGGVICMLAFQDLPISTVGKYQFIHDAILQTYGPAETLSGLLQTSGMAGMLSTIWLILAAMFFGGIMEACGFLKILTMAMLSKAKSETALVGATAASAILVNVSASDQYLSIVIPGRMFAGNYPEYNLAPENLSRTLEDAGTVTSVLVPWNTCGAYQSAVLGIPTLAFLPFAFFNILSPLMTLIVSWKKVKIKRIRC